jgi:uncharacterized protein with PIN domain
MNRAVFTFHAELNDFLPRKWKGISFSTAFEDHQTIKHLIESLGVPHCEINHLRANDHPIDFTYHLHDGESADVFPISVPPGPEDLVLQIEPMLVSRFILDNHLGRLAAYLRMFGFDSLYRNDYQDDELALVAGREGRTLLTRDRHLLMRNSVQSGYWLRSQDPQDQLIEVARRFAMIGRIQPFKRCLRCNHPLKPVLKEAVTDRLEPLTRLYYDEFHLCPNCNQIYWKGSHYDNMRTLILRVSGN